MQPCKYGQVVQQSWLVAALLLVPSRPEFDTTVQYVVVVDGFFLEYMATKHLTLELNRSRGLDYEPLATAHVPLRQIMQGLGTGLHVAKGASYQEAEVGLCCWALRVPAEACSQAAAGAAPAKWHMMRGLLQL